MNELESIELTIQELFEFLGLDNDDYDNAQFSKEEIYVKSDKNELIPVLSFVKKNNKPIYKCNIGNDEVIEVADTHIFRSNGEEVFAKDSEGLYLDTLGESVKVNKVEFNGYDDVYDFEVPAPHWYVHNENFANGLISHNTIFLINAGCDAILAGKNVAYFTFEETELEIRERFDARLMNISTSQFPKMGGALMSNFNVLINKGLGDLKIKAYGPRSASVLTVKAQLEEWELKEGFKPDIVILDSITIIAPSTKTDNMYMNGKNVSEEAKALGIQLGVPVISAVQFGRGAYSGGSAGMEDLSESLAIAQVASTMIAIILDEQRPDIRTISIIKSRKVNKSKVKAQNVHLDTDKQKVWDMDDGDKRVYIKAEQKQELETLHKIADASEKIKSENDIKKIEPGGSLLDSLLR